MDLTQIVYSFGSSTNPKTTNEEEEVKSTRRGLGQVIESSVKHHHSTPEASLRNHNKFTQLVMDVHDCLCNDDLIKAIRTKKKINRLFKRIMNIERSEESIKLMDDLFKLEIDLSMLIISELRRQLYIPSYLNFMTSRDSG